MVVYYLISRSALTLNYKIWKLKSKQCIRQVTNLFVASQACAEQYERVMFVTKDSISCEYTRDDKVKDYINLKSETGSV